MTDRREPRPDDPVRALLRAADPLTGEAPPTPTEIARWRIAMRDASHRASWRRGWVRELVPALGVAGAVVLAVILLPERGTRPIPGPVASADSPREIVAGAPDPADEADAESAPMLAPSPTPPLVARATPRASVSTWAAPARAQSLQFTAANGTRILWILDPNLDL